MTDWELLAYAETAPMKNAVRLDDRYSFLVFDDERRIGNWYAMEYIVVTAGDGNVVGAVAIDSSDEYIDAWDIVIAFTYKPFLKGFVLHLFEYGRLRQVWPHIKNVVIPLDTICSEADLNTKLRLCHDAGFDVLNESECWDFVGSSEFEPLKKVSPDEAIEHINEVSWLNIQNNLVHDSIDYARWVDGYLVEDNDKLADKGWLLWHFLSLYDNMLSVVRKSNSDVLSYDELCTRCFTRVFSNEHGNPVRRYIKALETIVGEELVVSKVCRLKLFSIAGLTASSFSDLDVRYVDGVREYRLFMTFRDSCMYDIVLRLARYCEKHDWNLRNVV
jgi:hypothetical protein